MDMDGRPVNSLTRDEEFGCLVGIGALPPSADPARYATSESPVAGLLDAWKAWLRTAPKSRRERVARIYSSLRAAQLTGAELTFNLPGCDDLLSRKWVGRRVCWWPQGLVDTRCVGLVSSRLHRDSGRNARVLQALRLSLTAVDAVSERLLASSGTSLCEYIDQCGSLFELPVLNVSVSREHRSATPWVDELVRISDSVARPDLLISPPVALPPVALRSGDTAGPTAERSSVLKDVPVRDLVIALLSQRLFILKIRRSGNWWKILRAGFDDGLWQPGSVRVVVGQGLCADDLVGELQGLGAVGWHLMADRESRSASLPEMQERIAESLPESESAASAELSPDERSLMTELLQRGAQSDWLVHWTRSPISEWAGERHDEYLNSVVLGDGVEDRTAFGTLTRIVREGLIRATPGNTRTSTDVVCLSAVPFTQLLTQRVFRQHRGRWDCEHYGIGVRWQFVRARGGRPVIYGNEETWQSLPVGERPWFQPDKTSTAAEPVDWRSENEWRMTGDLDLSSARRADVFVYCATSQEAVRLRSICNWRVVPVDQLMAMRNETTSAEDT